MALTKITPQMFDTSAAGHDFNIDNGTFVVDASVNRVGIGTATPSTLLDVNGTATATTFVGALTGNVTGNVSGTAATVTTAAQTNITSLGTLTALAVDNITIDGNEIDSTSGHIILDSADEIKLDAHSGIIRVQIQGGDIGMIRALNSDLQIRSMVADKDIVFYGNDSDGGGGFTALTLDMSAVGAATFAGPVLAPAGSASVPSLSFSGDPNTGLYSLAADNLGFAIGGSARAFMSATQFNMTGNIIASGNLGGTLTTAAQTNITSLGTLSSLAVTGTVTGGNATFSNLTVSATEKIRLDGAGGHTFIQESSNDTIVFATGGSARLTLAANATFSGDVNVFGTNRKLAIGESGAGGTFGHIGWDDSSNYLYLGTSYNSAFNQDIVLKDGKVGLGGQTNPQAKLDIKGNTQTYAGMSKIYFTDTSSNAARRNWAIGNGGSAYGNFTIGVSNAADGDPMATGTHTTPFVIDNTGKVGIGESIPLGKLHVKTADSGATVDVSADELVVESNGNAGISILSGQSYSGSIYFGDAGVNWDGYIAYSQAARKMNIGASAGATVLTIDSSGIYTTSYANDATNTVYGADAFTANVSGAENNTVIGRSAWYWGTSGDNNVVIGHNACLDNVSNINQMASSVYVGKGSGLYNAGNLNVVIGTEAGYRNYGGSSVLIGYRAGGYTNSSSSGNNNVAVGMNSLYAVTTGSDNVTLGRDAGSAITTGYGNVFLGRDAGDSAISAYRNICIGQNANPSQNNGEHQIILGHDISGPGDNHAMIGRGGQGYWKLSHTVNTGWVFVSDERIKKNIQKDTLGLEFINKIRPVTYNHKKNEEIDKDFLDSTVNWKKGDADDTVLHRGLVAQEVKAAMQEVGNTDFDGWSQDDDGMQGISKEAFITPLINAVKELSAEITALKAEVAALKGG